MKLHDLVRDVMDDIAFEKRLAKYARMTPEEKRKAMAQINARESRMALEHMLANEAILEERRLGEEIRRENPDGEWEDE